MERTSARADARRILTAVFGPLDHLWPRRTHGESADHAAFDAHAVRLTSVHLQVTGLLIVLLGLIAWPTDYLLFPPGSGLRSAVLEWRAVVVGVCFLGYLVLRTGLHLPPAAVGMTCYAVVMGASGVLMGGVGGLESPLFYGIYTAPLMTVMLVVGSWRRVLALAAVVVPFLAGFFGPHPEHLAHPQAGTPLVWLASSAVTAFAVGQVVTNLLRTNFVQGRILDRRARALEELDRLKNEFFANVNHELRTPLANILGSLRSLDRAGGDPDATRAIRAGMRAADRLLRLVEDLLALARLDSGRAALQPRVIDLGSLLSTIAEPFQGEAPDRLLVRLPEAAEARVARVDPKAIRTLVYNLLGNAFKFGRPDLHPVELSLETTLDEAVIRVADRGPGIPPAEHDRVFERFRRVESAGRPDPGGAGMGLALVRELASAHGGQVELRSAEGRGATFTVRLPRGDVAGQAPGSPDAFVPPAAPSPASALPPPAVPGDPEDPARPLVLVAEDDPDLRAYLAGVVGRAYRVRVAGDGEEALAAARSRPPDLVLTDVMMPRMSGHDLLAALHDDPVLARVPVVFLTALTRPEQRAEALREGASDYVGKPFDEAELLARIANLLRLHELTRRLERRVEDQTAELQRLAANLSDVQEQERRRLARELHDEAGQVLAALRMELDWLGRAWADGERPDRDLAGGAARATGLVDAIDASLDRVVAALRPAILDRRGLQAAVEALVEALPARHAIAGTASFDLDEDALDEARIVAAYRIVQEAVANAVRHARPTAIAVRLEGRDGACRIEVRDDGAGFDAAAVPPEGHFGLLGLRERARMVGGRCEVRSAPGAGTVVSATLPGVPAGGTAA